MQDDDFQQVMKTEFGPVWLDSAIRGNAPRTATAVFVEGGSLQGWALQELKTVFSANELERLIRPYSRERFEIHYYDEITSRKDEKAADKLADQGLHVHKSDRRVWPGPHSEELLVYHAGQILPLVKHLIIVSGHSYPCLHSLFDVAARQGCETTFISFSASRKFWKSVDNLVPIKTAWNNMLKSQSNNKGKINTKADEKTLRPRVAILPIRLDEEKAITRRMKSIKELFPGKHGKYRLAKIRRPDGDLIVAIKRIVEQGNLDAQNVARNVIEDLDPEWIVLVGIGGGIPANEYTLGDVVVATRVHDFSVGAYKEDGTPDVEFAHRSPPMHPRTKDLIERIPHTEEHNPGWNSARNIRTKRPEIHLSDGRRFYGSDDYRQSTKASLELHFKTNRRKRPIFWPAPVGGDGYLIKDTRIVTEWLKHSARDLGTTEMELAGVQNAADRLNKQYKVLCIRGLSDIVGYKREGAWTSYACETAAAFCVWLLKHMPADEFAKSN